MCALELCRARTNRYMPVHLILDYQVIPMRLRPPTLSSDEKRVTESSGRGPEVFDPLHGKKFDF